MINILLLSTTVQEQNFNGELALWLVLTAAFLIFEACTATLLTTWFAIGSGVAAVLAAVGVPMGWQVAVFFVVSVVLLLCARPFFNKILMKKKVLTNKDSLIGTRTFVTERVDNLAQTGYVKINGVFWVARSYDDNVVADEGELVEIAQIQGNKLIVIRTDKSEK